MKISHYASYTALFVLKRPSKLKTTNETKINERQCLSLFVRRQKLIGKDDKAYRIPTDDAETKKQQGYYGLRMPLYSSPLNYSTKFLNVFVSRTLYGLASKGQRHTWEKENKRRKKKGTNGFCLG